MKNLVMMVGLPRSGKSTIARELVKHTDAAIVNPDAIRLALHGHLFYAPAEPMVWGVAHTMVDSLFESGHSTVILDACSCTQKRRDEWKRSSYRRYVIEVLTKKDVCLSRVEDSDLIPVIERMAQNYEPPGPWEGLTFWTFADDSEGPEGLRGWSSTRQRDILRELVAAVRTHV